MTLTASKKAPTRQSKTVLTTMTRRNGNSQTNLTMARNSIGFDNPSKVYYAQQVNIKRPADETATQISNALDQIRGSHGKALENAQIKSKLNSL